MPTNGTFAKLYNPMINICAQCHNHAGASWTNNACEPHHSPQYNMLLGTIGESDSGLPPYLPGAHALLVTNQCAGCHMQTTPFVSDAQPATNGHSFKVETYNVCINCHFTTSSPLNEFLMTLLVTTVTNEIASQIQTVKFDLDYWATSTMPLPRYRPSMEPWPGNTPSQAGCLRAVRDQMQRSSCRFRKISGKPV